MLKRILLLTIIVSTCLISFGIYLYNSNLLLLKYYLGSARNLGKPITAKIYTNNKLSDSIKLFLHIIKEMIQKKFTIGY